MMEKSALAGESGGAHTPPFILFTITYKVEVYAPADKADTLPIYIYVAVYRSKEITRFSLRLLFGLHPSNSIFLQGKTIYC